MSEKKAADTAHTTDESANWDAQLKVDKQPEKEDPAVGNKQALTDQQALIDQQVFADKQALIDQQAFADKQALIDQQAFADKQALIDQQVFADKQALIDQQVFADKQALIDKEMFVDKGADQALVDRQSSTVNEGDPSLALPQFRGSVMGESWSVIKDRGGSLKDVPQSERTLKQPVWSHDDMAPHISRMVAAANATHAQAATIEQGALGTLTQPPSKSTGAGPDDGGQPGNDPNTTRFDREAFIDPATAGIRWLPLMHRDYVLEPVAIALGGGGSVGDFELGALDFIHKKFMRSERGERLGFLRPRFDIATGASVGAVNAGALAQGAAASVDELKDIWFSMTSNGNFYHLNDEFQRVVGNFGEAYGPAISKIVNDLLIRLAGVAMTGFFSLGFLSFLALGIDLKRLYEVLASQRSIMDPEPLAMLCRRFEPYWSPAGPGLRNAGISVIRDQQGHRLVFARGYDDNLYVRWQLDVSPVSESTSWSPWLTLGGPISSDPVAYANGFPGASRDPFRVGVIARLANERRYGGRTLNDFNDVTRVDPGQSTPFREWVDVPPSAPDLEYTSQPTIIQRAPNGHAWAFCVDKLLRDENSSATNSRSFLSVWEGQSWGPWTLFGQSWLHIVGNITGCSYFEGDLELFARGHQFQILHSFTRGGAAPGNWEAWGGKATSDLLVVLTEDPEYMVDVFWRGVDGQVWTRRKVGTRGPWGAIRSLGGLITSNLCSGRNANGICTVFARGLDDKLYELRQTALNGIWPAGAWIQVGAPRNMTLLADPYTLAGLQPSSASIAGIEVYAVASDHSVWMIRQLPAGGYTEWISLDGKIWTGMKLRMSVVALETGKDRYVDESGRLVDETGRFARTADDAPEPIVSSDGNISFARAQGAIASCAAPGAFPAIPLNGKTWVDGGMRRGVPVGAAIQAGASKVIAIATVPLELSTATRLMPRSLGITPTTLAHEIEASIGQLGHHEPITNYRDAPMVDVLVRSFVELLVNATSLNELYPETPWRVPVWVIQQTFKIHEGATIDPGLIRINYSYGWMRAFDVLLAADEEREAAMHSTDRIIGLRWEAWKTEAKFREAYLIATAEYIMAGGRRLTPELVRRREAARLAQRWLGESRLLKWELKDALLARRDAGFPLDPESPNWLAKFERFAAQDHWGFGWQSRLRLSEFLFEEIPITVASNWAPDSFERSEHSVGMAPAPTLDA